VKREIPFSWALPSAIALEICAGSIQLGHS
jgi:hypothetical protein